MIDHCKNHPYFLSQSLTQIKKKNKEDDTYNPLVEVETMIKNQRKERLDQREEMEQQEK